MKLCKALVSLIPTEKIGRYLTLMRRSLPSPAFCFRNGKNSILPTEHREEKNCSDQKREKRWCSKGQDFCGSLVCQKLSC